VRVGLVCTWPCLSPAAHQQCGRLCWRPRSWADDARWARSHIAWRAGALCICVLCTAWACAVRLPVMWWYAVARSC
jgi:hypothetical protein